MKNVVYRITIAFAFAFAIFMTLAGMAMAANEIYCFSATGQKIYCRIIQGATGKIYDSNSPAGYKSTADANATAVNTAITLTEDSRVLGFYKASMPTSVKGLYSIMIDVNTVAPAFTDTQIGSYELDWNGSKVFSPADANALVAITDANVAILARIAAAKTSVTDSNVAILARIAAAKTSVTDSNVAILARIAAAKTSVTDSNVAILARIAAAKSVIDLIVLDTNEVQTDWHNAGRLDLIADLILADTNWIRAVTEGDSYIDTAKTPWEIVINKKSTPATEYIRKKLLTTGGASITAETQIIGRHTEP